MKKVLIIGATGSLAAAVITRLQQMPQFELTLFMRNKKRLPESLAADAVLIEGDAMHAQDITAAIQGEDIIYVNLAGDLGRMGSHIVQAMQAAHVKRIIAISSIGIYEQPLKAALKPYRELADIIEASGLDYTLLRPDWFTDADEVDYALTQKGSPENGTAVSRKSIAAFVAKLMEEPALYIKANLGISKPN